MSFSFCSIASGSSGNCYVVKSEKTTLLVDVGISGKKIFEGLEKTGRSPSSLNGILISHEHSDHIKSLKTVCKKSKDAYIYSNINTWEHIKDMVPYERQIIFERGKEFKAGDIMVRPFSISHDASDPVGFSFFYEGKQLSIVTDTGCITEEIFDEILAADLIVLEANHDEEILKFCRYPYYVKRRILGDTGHLSNIAAAECISRLVKKNGKKRRVLLSHLSRENNTPEVACLTVKNVLQEEGVYESESLAIEVIKRDAMSPLYELKK